MEIESALESVLLRIRSALAHSGHPARPISLIAVSKRHPVSAMRSYAAAARRRGIPVVFGENYVQEAASKRREFDDLDELHMIGPLQTNKVRDAVSLFDVIQSVHSRKVLLAIQKEASRIGKRQRVLLQVNVSQDPAKSGFAVEDVPLVLGAARSECPSVIIEGLMTITANYEEPAAAVPDFRTLATLRDTIGDLRLSMGMSSDFELAIEAGADMVRVGTALFGER